MKKTESIENIARIIVNRVKYHSPILYDGDVNFKILEDFGIDTSIPIFKFENELSKPLMKAFSLAKEKVKFNFITTKKTKCPFALYMPINSVSLELLQAVNKLNINYKTNSLYIPHHNFDYIKIGGRELNLKYNNFCLEKHENIDGVLVTERQFVASGQFTVFELCNSNKRTTEIEIAYNKNLKNGYYFFKKTNHSLAVKNLYSQETDFLNTNCDIKNVYFSCVDGIENSSEACIKFSEKITLKPYQKKYIYFHFGKAKFSIKSFDEIERIFDISLNKCYKNFDIKISTKNINFDNKFNNILPRDIWINWLNGTKNIEIENEYIETKQKFVLRDKNKLFFNGDYKDFKRLYVFDGKEYRQIKIENFANENALVIGKTSFLNLKSVRLDKIDRDCQICLQFK